MAGYLFSLSEDLFWQYPLENNDENISLAKKTTYKPAEDPILMGMVHALWIHVPLIIVTNILVIAATILIKKLQTPDNLLIAGLAVADLLTGVISIPLQWGYFQKEIGLAYYLKGSEVVCKIVLNLKDLFSNTSLSILFLMSVDRFVAIKFPFVYDNYSTVRKTIAAMCMMFVSNAVMMGVGFEFFLPWEYKKVNATFTEDDLRKFNTMTNCKFTNLDDSIKIYLTVSVLWGQIVLGLGFTLAVVYIARTQLNRSVELTQSFYDNRELKKHIEHVNIMLVLVFIYVVLWIPLSLIPTINKEHHFKTRVRLLHFARHCIATNAWINAIVYAMSKETYKTAYYFLLTNRPTNWAKVNAMLRKETYMASRVLAEHSTRVLTEHSTRVQGEHYTRVQAEHSIRVQTEHSTRVQAEHSTRVPVRHVTWYTDSKPSMLGGIV